MTLGDELRALREKVGCPGREVAAAAAIDSGLYSKIETGKRLPTQPQLAAMAEFFKVPVAKLEARRVAEDMKKRYSDPETFAAAVSIVREESEEYGSKKRPLPIGKRGQRSPNPQ